MARYLLIGWLLAAASVIAIAGQSVKCLKPALSTGDSCIESETDDVNVEFLQTKNVSSRRKGKVKFNPGKLCNHGDGSNFVLGDDYHIGVREWCNKNENNIQYQTGGTITSDFCKVVDKIDVRRRRVTTQTSFIEHVSGPCGDPWKDPKKMEEDGCSTGMHRCLRDDYCIDSSMMQNQYVGRRRKYPHNICCGWTELGPLQCYQPIYFMPDPYIKIRVNCPSYMLAGFGEVDVCACSECGTSSVHSSSASFLQNGRAKTTSMGRELMPANGMEDSSSTFCDPVTGNICGIMTPCESANVSNGDLTHRNWFCNKEEGRVYISKAELDSNAIVFNVSHPYSWNKSNLTNFQSLAINPAKAYHCEPCSAFSYVAKTCHFNAKRTICQYYDRNAKEIQGKWCSLKKTGWDKVPQLGCDNLVDKDGGCSDGVNCCDKCPRNDPLVGRLAWLCKKNTNSPCINRFGSSIVDLLATKLLSDNVTVLSPPQGFALKKPPCSDQAWCRELTSTLVVLAIAAQSVLGPLFGMLGSSEVGMAGELELIEKRGLSREAAIELAGDFVETEGSDEYFSLVMDTAYNTATEASEEGVDFDGAVVEFLHEMIDNRRDYDVGKLLPTYSVKSQQNIFQAFMIGIEHGARMPPELLAREAPTDPPNKKPYMSTLAFKALAVPVFGEACWESFLDHIGHEQATLFLADNPTNPENVRYHVNLLHNGGVFGLAGCH